MARIENVFAPGQPENLYAGAPIVARRAPTVSDFEEIGTIWIDQPNDDVYVITSVVANQAIWVGSGGGTGIFAALQATTGNITATLGDVVITAGNLNVAAGTVTVGAFAAAGVVINDAAGILATSAGTNGQVLIGSTGAAPAWATLTAGAGITIAEGAGTITITNPGATGVTMTCTDTNIVAPDGLGNWDVLGYDANITTDGSVANTVSVRLSDAVTTVGALTAGVDLNMTSGDCTITADTDGAQTIYLHANGGITETIDIYSDQGTDAASIYVHSDCGGVSVATGLASATAISLAATTGGIALSGDLTVSIASAKNASDAIILNAANGGIDITAGGGAAEDIDLLASSSINLTSTENAALALYLHANGGTLETIDIHSDQGTDAASINLHSDLGGITLTSGLASNDAINLNATAGGVDIDTVLQMNLTSAQAAVDAIVIDASNAAGGIDLDYGTGGFTIDGANGNLTIQTGTGDISIGADAVQHDITIGNVTGDTVINLNAGTGGIALASTGAGDITLDSADTVLIDSAGVLELNSSAGVINIANDDIDQNVNIATDGVRILTLGSANTTASVVVNSGTTESSFATNATDHTTSMGSVIGTSATTIQSGTGAMTFTAGGAFDVNGTGAVTIDSSAGTIGIGIDDIDQAINIGTVGERVVTIGNIVGVTGIALNAGTGNIALISTGASPITVDSGSTVLIDSAGVLELNSSAGIISIGNDDVDQNVNLGTDGERTVTVGSTNGAAALTVQSGTGNFVVTAGGTLDVNSTGAVTIDSTGGAISIGAGADAHAINIATGAAARTVTVGNATNGTNLVLTGGDTGAVAVTPVTSSVGGVALTCSGNVGVATFTGQTTAAAAAQEFTITNTTCTVGSAILVSASTLGTNDAQMTVTRVKPADGSFVVTLTNNGAAALNGDVIITFWIVAA